MKGDRSYINNIAAREKRNSLIPCNLKKGAFSQMTSLDVILPMLSRFSPYKRDGTHKIAGKGIKTDKKLRSWYFPRNGVFLGYSLF